MSKVTFAVGDTVVRDEDAVGKLCAEREQISLRGGAVSNYGSGGRPGE